MGGGKLKRRTETRPETRPEKERSVLDRVKDMETLLHVCICDVRKIREDSEKGDGENYRLMRTVRERVEEVERLHRDLITGVDRRLASLFHRLTDMEQGKPPDFFIGGLNAEPKSG